MELVVDNEFAAVKDFRRTPKDKRLNNSHELTMRVRTMVILAVEICALDKTELVAKVRQDRALHYDLLDDLAKAKNLADVIREIIEVAEKRLAAAFTSIEG